MKPTFLHSNYAINTFVNYILDSEDIKYRVQFIIMAGITLSNMALIEYACELDPSCVNAEIENNVIFWTKSIIEKGLENGDNANTVFSSEEFREKNQQEG